MPDEPCPSSTSVSPPITRPVPRVRHHRRDVVSKAQESIRRSALDILPCGCGRHDRPHPHGSTRISSNELEVTVSTPTKKLSDAGVSIWLDDLSRQRLTSGTCRNWIDTKNVVGVTTNPTIFAAALADGESYAEQVPELAQSGADVDEAVFTITTDDVRDACESRPDRRGHPGCGRPRVHRGGPSTRPGRRCHRRYGTASVPDDRSPQCA